ncbi:hypothetical protein BJY52DRAFT_1129165, partial [Lactarius psammicola]
TSPRTHTASPEEPITQCREVHLLCGGKTVFVATSYVTIAPHCERLLLDEKFAIGKTFRKMQTPPQFALLDCGVRIEDGKVTLWRRYTLSTKGFLCDIMRVFPDRDIFKLCEHWLDEEHMNAPKAEAENNKHQYAANAVLIHV